MRSGCRSFRWAPVLACLALAGVGTAHARPRTVKVVSNVQRGTPSPDGTRFLYASGDDLVVANASTGKPILRIDPPAPVCGATSCTGRGIEGYAWSPDGEEIAFSVHTGTATTGLYVVDLAARPLAPRRVLALDRPPFGYDAGGELTYLTAVPSGETQAWHAGDQVPFLTLPPAAPGTWLERALHRTMILTTVKQKDTSGTLRPIELWRTELATGATRRLAVPARVTLSVSPAEDRACFLDETGALQCLAFETQAITSIFPPASCPRRDGSGRPALPWSPSGRTIAAFVCNKDRRVLVTHDFTTGITREVAEDDTFGRIEFQSEQHVLLLYGQLPKHHGRLHAGIVRIELATGDRYALVVDDTSYPHASPIPGRTDVLYAARDDISVTHLAWIDTRKPIGPAPRPTQPSDGTRTQWHENGRKALAVGVAQGVRHGELRSWDFSGKLMEQGRYVRGHKTARWTTWFPEGRVERIVEHVDGKLHGTETQWWRRGGRKAVIGWRRGLHHGAWRTFHANGRKSTEDEYRDGKHVGTSRIWGEAGRLIVELEWREGKQHGRSRRWHPNGKLATEGVNVDGQPRGEWRTYRHDGRLERVVTHPAR